MKKIIFIIVLLPVFLNAQDSTYARYIIDSLASPALHGRGYTFDGDQMAADFLAAELKKNRIKAFDNDYFQEFYINSNVFSTNMLVAFGRTVLIPGQDFIIKANMNSIEGNFKVFVINKESLNNKQKLIKMLDKNLTNIFVLIDTIGANGALDEYYMNLVNYNIYEAKGVITVSEKLTYVPSPVNGEIARIIIKRDALPKKTKKINVNITAEFKINYQTKNVIGYIPGQVDSFVLITAHYDHLGTLGPNAFFPGAHDNASGCAMTMDLAKYFGNIRSIPHYNLVFIFFSGEEIGLLGSKYFVDNPLFPLEKIRFVLNLDLVGSGDDGIRIVNSTIFTDEYKLLLDINQEHQLLKQIKKRGQAQNSDHYYFYAAGVPSYFVYSLGAYKEYHNIYDSRENVPLPVYNEMFKLFRIFIQKLHKI